MFGGPFSRRYSLKRQLETHIHKLLPVLSESPLQHEIVVHTVATEDNLAF